MNKKTKTKVAWGVLLICMAILILSILSPLIYAAPNSNNQEILIPIEVVNIDLEFILNKDGSVTFTRTAMQKVMDNITNKSYILKYPLTKKEVDIRVYDLTSGPEKELYIATKHNVKTNKYCINIDKTRPDVELELTLLDSGIKYKISSLLLPDTQSSTNIVEKSVPLLFPTNTNKSYRFSINILGGEDVELTTEVETIRLDCKKIGECVKLTNRIICTGTIPSPSDFYAIDSVYTIDNFYIKGKIKSLEFVKQNWTHLNIVLFLVTVVILILLKLFVKKYSESTKGIFVGIFLTFIVTWYSQNSSDLFLLFQCVNDVWALILFLFPLVLFSIFIYFLYLITNNKGSR